MKTKELDGRLWLKLIVTASKYLEDRKNLVDSLNVFPVPDGDTGTNMSLTMASAAKAVLQKQDEHIGNCAKQVAYGALMGARGNSGVILSQLFAGFAKRAEGLDSLVPQVFSEALESAVQAAYQAVMNPVEGTILTVAREAFEASREAAVQPDATIDSVLEAAHKGAITALQKTPSLLPVLKQAGVVDAGGQGLVYILEGMLSSLKGLDDPGLVIETEEFKPPVAAVGYASNGDVLEYQYCTEFILKKTLNDLPLDTIRKTLTDKGDCLLVVGNSDTAKIHIHTNYPGTVLDYCISFGSLHEIQIHNMSEQSKEMQLKARAKKHLGLIAVAVGNGLVEIFKSLGVDIIISGGQTMNPSTENFVEAIENILAEEIIILPNNSNIVLAARQAAKLSGKPVEVINTKTIPQGIAALMAFNAEYDLLANKAKMEEASREVISLEITYAVRDAQFDGHDIQRGQILGIVDGKLVTTGSNVKDTVETVIDGTLRNDHELVTIYYGEGIGEEEAHNLVEYLADKYPGIDFELHFGGQPLYYYLISLE